MNRLQRFWNRCICNASTHEVDWVWKAMTGVRRCIRCQSAMPEPPGSCLVGDLNPSVGD